MLRAATTLLLGACVALLALPTLCAVPGEGAWMYGLEDGTYDIWQLNPLLQTETLVYQTGFTDANGMAFDTVRDQLIFLVEQPVSDEGCWVFDIKTQTLTKVATLAAMGYAGGVPNNAAYYDGE